VEKVGVKFEETEGGGRDTLYRIHVVKVITQKKVWVLGVLRNISCNVMYVQVKVGRESGSE